MCITDSPLTECKEKRMLIPYVAMQIRFICMHVFKTNND